MEIECGGVTVEEIERMQLRIEEFLPLFQDFKIKAFERMRNSNNLVECTIIEEKEGVIKNIGFEDLPPRVIIHDILTFHKFFIPDLESIEDKYFLFGYFEKDYSRNIWFVFPSLHIHLELEYGESNLDQYLILNTSKIVSLKLECLNHEFYPKLITESSKMYSLKTLNILDNSDDLEAEVFSEKARFTNQNEFFNTLSKFPNLTTFKFSGKLLLKRSEARICSSNSFEKIENLKLNHQGRRGVNFDRKFFFNQKIMFQNIRKVHLEGFTLSKSTRIHFPKLEDLTLNDTRKLVIIPLKNTIRKICTKYVPQEDLQEVFRKSKTVEVVFMETRIFDDEVWFLDPKLNPLDHIKKLTLRYDYSFTNENLQNLYRLKDKFECLELCQDSFGNVGHVDIFHKNHFEKLKDLELMVSSEKSFSNFDWPVSLQLKTLYIYYCKDEIFQRNEWPVLESLEIWDGRGCTGHYWVKFPRLKRLKLYGLKGMNDQFFQGHDFNGSLEYLDLSLMTSLEGTGWNPMIFKRLKELKIFYNGRIDDSFFTTNHFQSLKELDLAELSGGITGKNWNVRSLERFRVVGCTSFGVDISEFIVDSVK